MRKTLISAILVISTFAINSCNKDTNSLIGNQMPVMEDETTGESLTTAPATITAYMREEGISKVGYSEYQESLSASWQAGDVICMTCVGRSELAVYYRATVADGNKATFTIFGDNTFTYNTSMQMYYYPGTKIFNDFQFMNFSYEGQVQKKSAPRAHLSEYHTMRKEEDHVVDKVNFYGGDQSACMRIKLSGMTFNQPSKIQIQYSENGAKKSVFLTNNRLYRYYLDDESGMSYDGMKTTNTLELGLEGYGTENKIDGYLMMSNHDVTLAAGSVLRVFVTCADNTYATDINVGSETTLNGGYCHTLSAVDGWDIDNTLNYQYPSYDGQAFTLQSGVGGLDIVIMGEGYTEEDFEDGSYEQDMMNAYNEFFSIEPYKSFQHLFNVYYVNTVSAEPIAARPLWNGAIHKEAFTRFSTSYQENSTNIDGDIDLAHQLAQKALGSDAKERITNATIIVMCKIATNAGTCHNSIPAESPDYSTGAAVAFCALGHDDYNRRHTLIHESGGHGFGRLADEYEREENNNISTKTIRDLAEHHKKGFYKNVNEYIDDYIYSQWGSPWILTTNNNVYWNDMFNTVNNYEKAEGLGLYKGAHTYTFGFCRSTETSVMREELMDFNAISRRAIFYRIRCLAGQNVGTFFDKEELDAFLSWDVKNIGNTLSKSSRKDQYSDDYVTQKYMPLGKPVIRYGKWINGYFVAD